MPGKRLLQDIARCNRRCKEATGDIDPAEIAALIETAFSGTKNRRAFLLQLGEYLGTAVDGTAINPETWRPLEHFPDIR